MRDKAIPFIYLFLALLFFAALFHFAPKPFTTHQEWKVEKKLQLPYTDSSMAKADILYKQHINDTALLHYQRLYAPYLKRSNWPGIVKCSYRIGVCYNRLGEKDSAYLYLIRAKTWAYEHLGESNIATVLAHFSIGEYYFDWGDPVAALQEFVRAKELLDSYHHSLHPTRPIVLDLIGEVYFIYYENGMLAEKYFKDAMHLRQISEAQQSAGMANNYYNLSKACFLKGDYDKALSYNDMALRLFHTLTGNFSSHISNGLNHAGNIYFTKREFEKAVPYYQMAINQVVNKPECSAMYVNELNNLGAAYMEMKAYDHAERSIAKSLSINSKNDTMEIVKSYFNLGLCKSRKGPDSALVFFNKSLHLCRYFLPPKHPQISLIQEQIAQVHEDKGQLDSALHYMQVALCALVESFDNPDVYSNPRDSEISNSLDLLLILHHKALLLEKKYTTERQEIKLLEASLGCYLLANNLMEKNREAFEREEAKLFLAGLHRSLYEHALHCLTLLYGQSQDPNYLSNAFELMEKSKSIVLGEILLNTEKMRRVGMPDSLRASREEILVSIAEIDFHIKTRNEVRETEEARSHSLLHLDSMKLEQEKKLQEWNEYVERLYPHFHQIESSMKMIQLKEVQTNLSENDIILEYFYGDSTLFMMGITRDSVKLIRLEKAQLVKAQIYSYKNFLTASPTRTDQIGRQGQFDGYIHQSHSLFEALIKPLLPFERDYDHLIVIPDGLLCQVPVEALLAKLPNSKRVDYQNLDYVLHQYEVSYSYSCQILFSKRESDQDKLEPLFLGYAESQNPSSNHLVLPNTKSMIQLAQDQGASFCYATKSNLRERLAKHNFIHFYVHAEADKDNPANNRILLQSGSDPKHEDGLYGYEIYGMNFQDKWVILNACETGVGKHLQGEGIYSMTRDFCLAGSKGVITSLWKINEAPTFAITKHFYSNLSSRLNVTRAFTQAKRNYLDEHDAITSHPSYWSGLILMQYYYPTPMEGQKIFWIVLITTMLLMAGIVWRKVLWKR